MTTLLLAPLLALAAMTAPPGASFAEKTQAYYAQKDAGALEALLARAEGREDAFLCRYRLYPLTENAAHIATLPENAEDGSARAMALLAGLWGYRASRGSLFQKITYGRRSQRLLDAARAQDSLDPYVLLIEGQSLLFRPALVGGNAREALRRFRRLRSVLEHHPDAGIAPMEADLWTWYALDTLGSDEAPALRRKLLAQNPPPLYREFLTGMGKKG